MCQALECWDHPPSWRAKSWPRTSKPTEIAFLTSFKIMINLCSIRPPAWIHIVKEALRAVYKIRALTNNNKSPRCWWGYSGFKDKISTKEPRSDKSITGIKDSNLKQNKPKITSRSSLNLKVSIISDQAGSLRLRKLLKRSLGTSSPSFRRLLYPQG